MKALLRLAAVLAGLTFLYAAPARAFDSFIEADGTVTYEFAANSLRITSAGALDLAGLRRIEAFADVVRADDFSQPAVDAALRTDYVRVPPGDAHNLTLLPGGALSLSGTSGPDGFVRADGGEILIQGYFSPFALSAGLIYVWTGNDRPLLPQQAPVPEPGTDLLLAAGLALLAARRGRPHAPQ